MVDLFGLKARKELEAVKAWHEKREYDLQQLIEISKSLNSTLDYNTLVQSIMYICMGQLKVLRACLFTRKEIDRQCLVLHRSLVGFEIDHGRDYLIPEGHPVTAWLHEHSACHTWDELLQAVPAAGEPGPLSLLKPYLVVPLRAKNVINGLLLLGEPIEGVVLTPSDRSYLMDIATLAGIAVHNAFLYEITTTDLMTKLKLRHFFIDSLQDQMMASRRDRSHLSLIMIDIDSFKHLNDAYGHLCGDQVIRQVSQVLLDCIRQTDLAARFGGEEFIIMLPETDLHTALLIAERLRTEVEEARFNYEGKEVQLTISLGVAEFNPTHDVNTFNFINRADGAMYQSKKAGKNKVSVSTPGAVPSKAV